MTAPALRAEVPGPHAGAPVLHAGAPPGGARRALVLFHGRGAVAEDILGLGEAIAPEDWTLLAPQAAGDTWYPNRFLAPFADNEPWLSSALAVAGACLGWLSARGVAAGDVALAGFSQGACLALEFAARAPRRYAALLGFAGGRIGPLGFDFAPADGDFAATPTLLSCGVPDPHIPERRVRETAEWFTAAGAAVELRLVPGLGHTIDAAAARRARAILAAV